MQAVRLGIRTAAGWLLRKYVLKGGYAKTILTFTVWIFYCHVVPNTVPTRAGLCDAWKLDELPCLYYVVVTLFPYLAGPWPFWGPIVPLKLMFVFMELSMSPIPCGLSCADMCCIVHPSTHSYMVSVGDPSKERPTTERRHKSADIRAPTIGRT